MSYQPNHPGYRTSQPAPRSAPNSMLIIRLVYVVMGLILGGVWLASSGQSLISHVWHDLVVLVAVLLIARTRLRQRQNKPGAPQLPQLSFGWIIGAKLVLLIIAAGAELLMQRAGVGHADLIVAAGLFVIVAIAGPPAHHLFIRAPKHA